MQAKRFDLDSRAIGYIRDILTNDRLTLSKCLLSKDLEKGKIFTILPKAVSEEELYQFTYGGKLPVPQDKVYTIKVGNQYVRVEPLPSMDNWLVKYIYDHLSKYQNLIVIFAGDAKPDYPWLSKRRSRIMIYRNEVYHFLTKSELNMRLIKYTVQEAAPFPARGFFVIVEEKQLQKWQGNWVRIKKEDLKLLAEQTKKIVISVYDFESYLVWEKD